MAEIDTEKIRDLVSRELDAQGVISEGTAWRLFDAMVAARVERDQNWDLGNAMTIGLGVAAEQRDRSIARAEAAERNFSTAIDMLHASKARIAAALDIHKPMMVARVGGPIQVCADCEQLGGGDVYWPCDTYRALKGDTP